MNRIIKLLLGVIFVGAILPAHAQTTRDLFSWYKNSWGSASFSFTDSSCNLVTNTTYSGGYTGNSNQYHSIYCGGYAKEILKFQVQIKNSSGQAISCYLVSYNSDSNLIYEGISNDCAGGSVKAKLPPPPLTIPRDLAYWAVT